MRSDGRLPDEEATLTIRPQPLPAISGAAARISRIGAAHVELPLALPVVVGQLVERLDRSEVPALLTSTSMPPSRSAQAATMRSPASGCGDVGGEQLGAGWRRRRERVRVARDEQHARALGREQLAPSRGRSRGGAGDDAALPLRPRSMTPHDAGRSGQAWRRRASGVERRSGEAAARRVRA